MQTLKKYHLTFDIDWAPDFAIDIVLSLLARYNAKATFFVTHQTDILSDIQAHGHELGIHPNFLVNSSHGKRVAEIMEHVMRLAPSAKIMRTHSLFQSTPMFIEILKNFPQLKLDISVLTYKYPLVKRFDWFYENLKIERINYNWEDDIAFFDDSFSWNSKYLSSELNILDFHPIHVALNSCSMKNYNNLKQYIGDFNLNKCEIKDIENFRNNFLGTFDFLENILKSKNQEIALNQIL